MMHLLVFEWIWYTCRVHYILPDTLQFEEKGEEEKEKGKKNEAEEEEGGKEEEKEEEEEEEEVEKGDMNNS